MRFLLSHLARRAIFAARSPAVRLDFEFAWTGDAIQTELGEARWIQIATAGAYKGHRAGEFKLDDAVFAEIVRNFRGHPSFKADATGVGVAPVVAFDWRHASEDPAGEGALAIVQQAAQGWATDLQVRTLPVATKDGAGRPVVEQRATLWALACMLEPAKSLIQAGKIRWTSVAIWPDTPDTVTGQNIGWYLSSIALTNDPFIQGMYPIAADRTGGAPVLAGGCYIDPYNPPKTAAEVIERLRRIFGLAEMADLGEVLRQLATLRAVTVGQMAAPPGVDVADLVGALRSLFNLPTLSGAEEVFTQADKLVAMLADEQAVRQTPAAPPTIPTETTIAAGRAAQHQDKIIMDQLLKILAAAFRCSPTQEAVLAAVTRHKIERVDLARLFKLAGDGKEPDGDETSDAEKAMAKIKALLAAAGVENVDDATKQLVQKCADVKGLMETVPELMSVLSMEADEEDKVAMEDTEQVMASRGYTQRDQTGRLVLDRDGADYANILLHRRTGGMTQFPPAPAAGASVEVIKSYVGTVKGLLAARRAARTAFVAEYAAEPQAPAGGGHYLLGRIAAPGAGQAPASLLGRMGVQGQGFGSGAQPGFGAGPMRGFGAPAFADPSLTLGRGQGQGAGQGGNAPADLPDLGAYGGNRTQRLLAAAATRAGAQWAQMTQEQRYGKKRELEQLYQRAGVDLSEFDVVAPEGGRA